jgi:uncharacterized protein (DUF2147 family)
MLVLLALLAGFAVGLPATAEPADDAVLGLWTTEGGSARVEIFKLEKPKEGEELSKEITQQVDAEELESLYSTYCGKIVWLKDPVFGEGDPEAGKPIRDRENPDPEKQNNPMIGLFMVKGFTYEADSKMWKNGSIYDPDNGKTYKCQMGFDETDPKKLNLRGYLGIPAFGRTTVWEKYEEPEEEEKEE